MTTDNQNYEDIIHLPHHRSATRPAMAKADRAAQFSPFAALTGYEKIVEETAKEVKETVQNEITAEEIRDC